MEKLVILLKKKDKKTQYLLYEKYSKKMFLLILRYINDEDQAKSLVNLSFHKVFQKINQFTYTNDHSLEAWLRKIVINESLIYLRKNKKLIFTDDENRLETISYQTTDHDLIAEDYFNLIRELPDGYRIIFNLFAIEGYSHEEIAKKLNIKESTSRSQLAHARAFLKKRIEKYF